MRINYLLKKYFLITLLISFLLIFPLEWVHIRSVGPCWNVLFLLPLSLGKGIMWGSFVGICLGLLTDGLRIDTHISVLPALIVLGIWWGAFDEKDGSIELIFNLGLLALLGSLIFGLFAWGQILIFKWNQSDFWLNSWAFQTLLSQSVLTGLIAPLTTSWFYLISARTANNK